MYERIIREAMQTPWALTPRYLAVVQDILRFRASGGRLTAEELRARIGGEDGQRAASGSSRAGAGANVAVIPIYGVIAHRNFEASSGMTSAEWIGALVDRAATDDNVSAILFDVSSPGGTVEGIPELGQRIAAASKAKPTLAHSNGLMASAAFWLGSQAGEVSVTPSGGVGSVGVYALFEDWSDHLANEGIKINAISAGDNKLEGAFWEPMSDETRAHIQAQVDKTYADFLAAVAKGRSTTVTDVKKNYGQGRVLDAKDALAVGMVDRVETMDQAIVRLAKSAGSAKRSGAAAATSSVQAVSDAADSTCATCGGSGLKPERCMSDPQGQEPCDACGGTGKNNSDAEAIATQNGTREAFRDSF